MQLGSRAVRLFLCVAMALCAASAFAQHDGPQPWWPVQPVPLPLVHPLFSDEAVLQREIAVPIWGWSTPGDKVTVTLDWEKSDGRRVADVAVAGDDGKWMTKLAPQQAGGPHTLTIEFSTPLPNGQPKKIHLKNILFGDVWLCTGQSNMNWPVRLSDGADAEVKQANNPEIRSFTVSFYPSLVPTKIPPPAKWQPCTPEFVGNFTGVGYYFAKEIQSQTKIPIGIIHTSAGATTAESWTSSEALQKKMPYDFPDRLAEVDKLVEPGGPNFDYFRALETWTAKVDPLSAERKYISDQNLNTDDWLEIDVPKPWEETGLAPLANFDGLVWFRHELEIPAEWEKSDLICNLSFINDYDIFWLNGQMIGSKQVPGTRPYRIKAGQFKVGKNVILVAVLNQKGPGGFCSEPANMVIYPTDDKGGVLERPISPAGKWKCKPVAALSDLKTPFPTPQLTDYTRISALFNGMLAPLIPYGIKGALWYQGEANGPFWLQYRRLLPTLIADWRERFEVGDFPFLIVSLANYNPLQTKPVEPGWAEIRESQWRTTRRVPNTGLAMTIDIGNANDIHPRNKAEVGRRLSLVARKLVYGEKDLIASGPEFTEYQIELPKGDKIRLYFKNIGSGLMIKPGDEKLTGFVVAGFDRQWAFADAVIDGDTILVSSPEVPEPKYVRYGWAWNPLVNLYNKEGLPAITFRTDE